MRINAVNRFDLARLQPKDKRDVSPASFENILNEQVNKLSAKEMFNNLFPTYNVSCKIGNCEVSSADWERNDFPSWKFFEEHTKADELNNWKVSGKDASFMDKKILNSWDRADDRKMVIIIPDELAVKMESDSIYAKQVLNKVYSWQTNHAALEQSLSEGYGYDGELSTFQDSYLLKLDEDGSITDYVVTGPGYDSSLKKDEAISYTKSFLLKDKKLMDIGQEQAQNQVLFMEKTPERVLYDYTSSLGVLAAAWRRKKSM